MTSSLGCCSCYTLLLQLMSIVPSARNLLCNTSFLDILHSQGCRPCSRTGEACLNSSSSYECYVKCQANGDECFLGNLSVAWCFIYFTNVTVYACSAYEGCVSLGSSSVLSMETTCSRSLFIRSCRQVLNTDVSTWISLLCPNEDLPVVPIAIAIAASICAVTAAAVILLIICRVRDKKKKYVLNNTP